MIAMTVLIAFFLGAVIVANISLVHSGEGEVTGQYSSHMEFGEVKATFSIKESVYDISGVYVVSHSPPTASQTIFDWIAKGRYNDGTKATEEKFDLFNTITRTMAASFTSTMVCDRDPWRDPTAAPCRAVVTTSTGSPAPGAFPLDLPAAARGLPFSARLSKTQRAQLNHQYKIFLAKGQKHKPGEPPPVQILETSAPTIVSPAQNGYMVRGKSKFIINPAPKFDGTEILIHFTPLDTKEGVLKEIFPWRQPTSSLAKGVDIPENIFQKRTGPWKMNARISAPQEGDVSPDVHFRYLLQSPGLIPPSKPPVQPQGTVR